MLQRHIWSVTTHTTQSINRIVCNFKLRHSLSHNIKTILPTRSLSTHYSSLLQSKMERFLPNGNFVLYFDKCIKNDGFWPVGSCLSWGFYRNSNKYSEELAVLTDEREALVMPKSRPGQENPARVSAKLVKRGVFILYFDNYIKNGPVLSHIHYI